MFTTIVVIAALLAIFGSMLMRYSQGREDDKRKAERDAMNPQQQRAAADHDLTMLLGPINPMHVCPKCQEKGGLRTRPWMSGVNYRCERCSTEWFEQPASRRGY